MTTVSLRQKKISEQIKREILNYITLILLKDNPLRNIFTITSLKLTADIKNARVYLDIQHLDYRVHKLIIEILNDAVPNIKEYISSNVPLKFIPEIKFFANKGEGKEVTPENTKISTDEIL